MQSFVRSDVYIVFVTRSWIYSFSYMEFTQEMVRDIIALLQNSNIININSMW